MSKDPFTYLSAAAGRPGVCAGVRAWGFLTYWHQELGWRGMCELSTLGLETLDLMGTVNLVDGNRWS